MSILLKRDKTEQLETKFQVYSTLVILILYDSSTFKQIAVCLIFFKLNLQRERNLLDSAEKIYT